MKIMIEATSALDPIGHTAFKAEFFHGREQITFHGVRFTSPDFETDIRIPVTLIRGDELSIRITAN